MTMAPKQPEHIRQRAYELWEKSGRAHGRDKEHWAQAERELAGEQSPEDAPKQARRPRAATPKASAARPRKSKPASGEPKPESH